MNTKNDDTSLFSSSTEWAIILDRIYFLTKEDGKTLLQRGAKLGEETGEVLAAILSYQNAPGCGYKAATRNDVVEEAVDCAIIAFSILAATHTSTGEAQAMFNKKLDKWRAVLEKDSPFQQGGP